MRRSASHLRNWLVNKANKCRSCGAAILWAETPAGRRMPLDEKPTTAGNILLGLRHERPPIALYQTEQQLEPLRAEGELLYVSHFATCKDAKRWRKKR
jgi:hypothetical protein